MSDLNKEPNFSSTEEKKSNTKDIILYCAIGALTVLSGILAFSLMSTKSSSEKEIAAKTSENLALQEDYSEAIAELDDISTDLEEKKGVNDQLDSIIFVREQEIDAKKTELRRLISSNSANKNKIKELQSEISSFRAKIAEDRVMIDSLYSANAQLAEANTQLTTEKATLTTELAEEKVVTQQLTVNNESLSKKYELGKLLQPRNILATGVRIKDDGAKIVETSRIKRMDKLQITFNTGANKVNTDGSIATYIRVMNAQGKLLGNAGKFESKELGELSYSKKVAFEYDNKDKLVKTYLNNDGFTEGTQTLEIYQDGLMIGGAKFDLK